MKRTKLFTVVAGVLLLLLAVLFSNGFASTPKPILILGRGCAPDTVCPQPATTFTATAVISQDIFASGGTVTKDGRLAAPVGTPIHYTVLYHPGGDTPANVTLPPQVDLCGDVVNGACTGDSTVRGFSSPPPCLVGGDDEVEVNGQIQALLTPCGIQVNDQTSEIEFLVVVVGKPGQFFQLTFTAPDGTVIHSAPIEVVSITPGPPA